MVQWQYVDCLIPLSHWQLLKYSSIPIHCYKVLEYWSNCQLISGIKPRLSTFCHCTTSPSRALLRLQHFHYCAGCYGSMKLSIMAVCFFIFWFSGSVASCSY